MLVFVNGVWLCFNKECEQKTNLTTLLLRQQVLKNNQHLYWMKLIHTSLNSSLWATASKHSCPVLSTDRVNSTMSPLRSWIRVTRQLLLETVYLRVLLSLKPNGKGMFHTACRGNGLHLFQRSQNMWEEFKSWTKINKYLKHEKKNYIQGLLHTT